MSGRKEQPPFSAIVYGAVVGVVWTQSMVYLHPETQPRTLAELASSVLALLVVLVPCLLASRWAEHGGRWLWSKWRTRHE